MPPSHLTLSDLERSNSRTQEISNLISCKDIRFEIIKGTQLAPILLLNIKGNPIWGLQLHTHLTLKELVRSKLRSLGYESLASPTGAQLGQILLLPTNRKSYMGSTMAPLDLDLGLKSRSLRFFKVLYIIKEPSPPICYYQILIANLIQEVQLQYQIETLVTL